MNSAKKIIYGLVLLLTFSNAFALKTKFDLTIYERDLIAAHVHNVEHIKSHLNIRHDDAMIIKHVVSTGREMATKQYVMLDIKALESIRPKMKTTKIMREGKQSALSEKQTKSIIRMLEANSQTVPKWLTDTKTKKYINTVLVKKDNHKDVSPLSTNDSRALVKWAIKHKQLYKEDHPAHKALKK